MKSLFCLAAGFAFCCAVSASAEWIRVTSNDNGAVWFVDPATIKSVSDAYNGSVRKVWVKIDYSNDKTKRAREAKVLFYLKCDEEKLRYVSWVQYDAMGAVIDSDDGQVTYSPAVPESMGSAVLRAACP